MDEYIDSITRLGNEVLFFLFKISVIVITALLIFSLIMLIAGCVLKSQKLRSKYLKASISLLVSLVILLLLSILIYLYKNLM